jgi:hypothetical protein
MIAASMISKASGGSRGRRLQNGQRGDPGVRLRLVCSFALAQVQRELAEIVATPTRISLYGDGERCGYPEECRLCYNLPCFRGDISEELTMTKSILISLAVLTLSTSAALAAHRTHHRHAMNTYGSVGASPVVWTGGVSSSDHATYIRNLQGSGYDPKNNFDAKGILKTQ